MSTMRYLTVVTPFSTFAVGNADSLSMRNAFPSSPLYNGSYSTEEQVQNAFLRPAEYNPTTGEINDGGYAFGTINVEYRDSPNLTEVRVGGGGLPGSPWAPNIASPGEGNGDNASAIPATGVAATLTNRGAGGAWSGDGLASPSVTARRLVPRRLGGLVPGFGGRV